MAVLVSQLPLLDPVQVKEPEPAVSNKSMVWLAELFTRWPAYSVGNVPIPKF